jgi:hypothetical protein
MFLTRVHDRLLRTGLAPSPSPAMPAPLRAAAHTYQKAMDTLTRDLGLVA